MIHRDGNMIELEVKVDVYSDPNRKGEQKLLKKDLILRRLVDINAIQEIGEVFNHRGTVVRKECAVVLAGDDRIIVNLPYEEMIKFKKPMQIQGFRYGKKRRKRRV